ncbi:hypothetical protein R3P38DRAFT_603344 [Favolaschia claudopus]|uniref:Uncharacterized protein n=1 Tax=Favolaschia claudopus TaxID=2862362 RepID=A0AAW0CAV2_9AGAR
MYAIRGGRALAEALEGVSSLIPLPFLSAFLNVGIEILEACEQAITIEENVRELQQQVYDLMLAVVETVPVNKRTPLELREKIQRLQRILDDVLVDVEKVREQNKWLLLIFRDLNKDRVDRCVARLNAALQQFQIVSQLHVEDLLDRIRADCSAFAAQGDRIEAAMQKSNQLHNAPSPYPRQDIPPSHPIFHGRDALINDIASLLVNPTTSRVCVNGVGGMGKTSVALAVAESLTITRTFKKEYIFWIPCVEAKSSDILRRILYAQLRVTAETYDSLDLLLAELDATKERRLLLLDNFETPWLSGQDGDKVGHILARLAALSHIALLVTMTSGFTPGDHIQWQHRPLSALDPVPARAVFRQKYRDAAGGHELPDDDRELDEFLASIGYMPLAITLAAASAGRLRASPADLLLDWRTAGTGMLCGSETMSMDETIRLSMERGVVKSNPEALRLLAILSMLPAGTTGYNLRWWAPKLASPSAAVQTLRAAALIEQGDGPFSAARIFVRPTIQSYMSQQNRISAEVRGQVHEACYRFVLDHKSIPDDRKFKDDLTALASEETNIHGLLVDIDLQVLRPHAVDAAITFALYQSWTKPSILFATHTLQIARAAYSHPRPTDPDAAARRVAEAHRCLGKTLFSLDHYDNACVHFEEARNTLKSLSCGADLSLAGECSMELLNTLTFMETQDEEELHSLVEEAQADLTADESRRYDVARGLLGLGYFSWWSDRPDEDTLAVLHTAKAIFEELDCPASTAQCLHFIARTYASRNEFSKALPIVREALFKAEGSGEVGLLCRVSGSLAGYLIVSAMYEEALVVITRLLTLCRARGSPLAIGQSLEFLAYNCAATSDFVQAVAAYTAAQAQYSKISCSPLGRDGLTRCSDNLESLDGADSDWFARLSRPHPIY